MSLFPACLSWNLRNWDDPGERIVKRNNSKGKERIKAGMINYCIGIKCCKGFQAWNHVSPNGSFTTASIIKNAMLVSVDSQKLIGYVPLLLEIDLALLFLSILENRISTKLSSYINLFAPCHIQTISYTVSFISISTAVLCLDLKAKATDSKKSIIKSTWKSHAFKDWIFTRKQWKPFYNVPKFL